MTINDNTRTPELYFTETILPVMGDEMKRQFRQHYNLIMLFSIKYRKIIKFTVS